MEIPEISRAKPRKVHHGQLLRCSIRRLQQTKSSSGKSFPFLSFNWCVCIGMWSGWFRDLGSTDSLCGRCRRWAESQFKFKSHCQHAECIQSFFNEIPTLLWILEKIRQFGICHFRNRSCWNGDCPFAYCLLSLTADRRFTNEESRAFRIALTFGQVTVLSKRKRIMNQKWSESKYWFLLFD